jgi:hypothetical protein
MLLEFDLGPVRVVDEKLQYPISPAPFYGEISDPACTKLLGDRLNIICLEAKMSEQAFLMACFRLLKEFEKAATTCVEKKPIALAGGIAELVGDLKSEDTHIESFGGRQIA